MRPRNSCWRSMEGEMKEASFNGQFKLERHSQERQRDGETAIRTYAPPYGVKRFKSSKSVIPKLEGSMLCYKPPNNIWTLNESDSHWSASSRSRMSRGFSEMNVRDGGSSLLCPLACFFLHAAVMSEITTQTWFECRSISCSSLVVEISEKNCCWRHTFQQPERLKSCFK